MDISALRDRPTQGALTVTELNNFIKNLIDSDRTLAAISVTGEISNFTDHRSGHLYFSLKDADAQIRAVMFRSARARLKFAPQEGMKVTVHGSVSLYPQGGTVQLYVNNMAPDGLGALYKAYEQLKEKLAAEGLFDDEHKKPIPKFPARVGVITSPTGAAVRDIINVTGRRYPLAQIYLYPSLVQGEGAEADLVRAIDYFEASGLVDVIIIGRGGGSIEDLWSFNSEKLARRIFSAKTPIISAVGHETDFTICDFVKDLRAPTPSAAAELAVPDLRDIMVGLDNVSDRIVSALRTVAERKRERLERIADKPMFKDAELFFEPYRDSIAKLNDRAALAITDSLREKSSDVRVISGKLDALSPLAVLSRGYSIVEKDDDVVFAASDVAVGDNVSIRFKDGTADASINSIKLSRKEKNDEKECYI